MVKFRLSYLVLALSLLFVVCCSNTPGISVFPTEKSSSPVLDRTVLVEVDCGPAGGSGSGSGFILEKNRIITAKHVIDDAENCFIFVTSANDFLPGAKEKHKYPAVVLRESEDTDVALLVTSKDFKVGTSLASAELGEEVLVIGFPGQPRDWDGTYLSVTRGLISALWVDGLHDVTARVYLGNSGGPVFNKDKEVVGIVVMLYRTRYGVVFYYMLPSETINEFLNE